MVCDAPKIDGGAAGVPRIRPRRSAGRPQRGVRHRVPARRRGALPDRVARVRRCCARSGWPGGCSPATRPPACGCPRWPRLFGAGHHADAPGARRRARHRRRAARADRAGRQPGRAHLHRPALLSARRDAGAAPQAGTWPRTCRTGPASTCSAGRRPRCSTSAPRWICARRVGQYFNGADPRAAHQGDGRRWPTAVDHVECAHDLEAGVRELRLLAAHAPPYNRRSKFPQRWWWVVLTDEAFPRLSIVRDTRKATAPSGRSGRAPTPSRRPTCWPGSPGVRTCTTRIAPRRRSTGPPVPSVSCRRVPAPRGIPADRVRRRRRGARRR